MNEEQERLLRDLKDVRDRGGHSLKCEGAPNDRACELAVMGYADRFAGAMGNNFWSITEDGVEALELIDVER